MFLSPKTTEILAIVPRDQTDKKLGELEGMATVVDFDFPQLRKLYPERGHLVELSSKLSSFSETLGVKGKAKPCPAPVDEAEQVIAIIETRLQELSENERQLRYELGKLEAMKKIMDVAEFVGVVHVFSESVEHWENRREELEQKRVRVIATSTYEHEIIVLAKGTGGDYSGDEREITAALDKAGGNVRTQIDKLAVGKKEIADKYGPKVNALKDQIDFELSLLEEKKMIAHSELFTFIKGTIPSGNLENLQGFGVVLVEEQRRGLIRTISEVMRRVVP